MDPDNSVSKLVYGGPGEFFIVSIIIEPITIHGGLIFRSGQAVRTKS